MTASTPCSAISAATSAWSPMSPTTSGAPFGDRPVEAGREIVEHDDPLAGVEQRMDHVAADIAGAAGDQDRHALGLLQLPAITGLGLM